MTRGKPVTEEDVVARIQQGEFDECWPWQHTTSHGYGRLKWAGKAWQAHRFVFFKLTGLTPEAVRHDCDNPICCNPFHLTGGTQLQNIADMCCKKRQRNGGKAAGLKVRGERHGRRKLSKEQVAEMRADYGTGAFTQKELAKKFGVGQSQVSRIVNRKKWSHGA